MSDDKINPDATVTDAISIAQRALQKANELDRLQEELADLKTDLAAVNLRLSEFDENRDYKDLTREDRIGEVREHAFRRASEGRGTAKLDYKDIKWSVFDGGPGYHQCYNLMRWAAEARGFEDRDPTTESRHLFVDAAEAKRGATFCPRNKNAEEGDV